MSEILIWAYVVLNLYYVIKYIKKGGMSVFTPVFIVAALSLSTLLPQLTSVYFSSYYPKDAVPRLAFMMVACNWAFFLGFERVEKKQLHIKNVYDIKLDKLPLVILTFSIIGLYSMFASGDSVDGVITANLRGFSQFAYIFSLAYLCNYKKNVTVIIALCLSVYVLIHYAFFEYGSRGTSLVVFMVAFFLLAYNFSQKRKLAQTLTICFLLLGSIVSASISLFRENIIQGANVNIDYVDNFKSSFMQVEAPVVGMDIGNACLLMDYCEKHNSYDYGMIVWNGFVNNYVPKRWVGAELKYSLQTHPEYEKKIPETTYGVTTVTGYFEAFAAWGYLGFMLFFFIGYLLGQIYKRTSFSKLYLILYLYCIGNFPLCFTHNLQYIFARIEMLAIFIFPMLYYWIFKRKIRYNQL